MRVALTFDAEHPDRPHRGGNETRLLDALDRAAVPATFFVQGRWAESEPALLRRMASAGHLVGNHSHYHARMPLLSPSGFRTDVHTAARVIRNVAGVEAKPWFRLPFGAGADDATLIARLRGLGYRHAGWHVAPGDWLPRRSARGVTDTTVAGVAAHGDGAIVLLHAWPDATAAAITSIVASLRADGATLVRLDALDLPPDLAPIGEPQPWQDAITGA